ncbi:Poly(A) RNA polymerase protein cid1 [Naviculisporaceae sp. PSN 640]
MNPAPLQKEGSGLEDRLRGLILSHPSQEPTAQGPPGLPRPPPGYHTMVAPGPAFSSNVSAEPTAKPSRKRPNQAQRREMSAQLSIPIEPRHQAPPAPQSARPYVSPQGPPPQQFPRGGGQHGYQAPRSATFRPSSRGKQETPYAARRASVPSQPRHQPSHSYHGPSSSYGKHDWKQHGPRTGEGRGEFLPNRNLFNPENIQAQIELLEGLSHTIVAGAEIEVADIAEKENFRIMIETVARNAIWQFEREQNGIVDFPPDSVQLRCFGSLSSGFATKAADMDLGLLSPLSKIQPDAPNSPIPRLVEKAFLDIGLGARLLTRTRVPIIKVCEKPPSGLRQDLLEERAKWDKGLDKATSDEHTHEEPDSSPTTDGDLTLGDYNSPREGRKFPSLNQGKKSLQNYFGTAKAILRRLGGRDLSNNYLGFTDDDYRFINDFSREYVQGLADSELRERLFKYRSLRRQDIPNYRSLHGVHTQVEGERLLMLWESRQIGERDEYQERQARKWLTAWQELQDKPDYGSDPLRYNKELSRALDQLNKIPSIALFQHSQLEHESAVSYHQRTSRLLVDLGGFDTPSPKNHILPAVIRQYIRGIRSEEIRRQMEEFAESHPGMSLRSVARRHKSLQLAHEYEKCLEKGLYPDRAVPLVESYIKALREPLALSQPPGRNLDNLVVPCTSDLASKGIEILRLGNPAKLSPNQPRDPYRDRLEFPKSGVGVQCDINFSAHLALQNTLLLRCYSHCDPRVRPLVLFVKHWAKVRGINTPYRGTLSSYGYVLMVLHYLVNVVQPFVCPNLQLLAPPPKPDITPEQIEETVCCKGRDIRFWRDEAAIKALARENALNQNRDSIGQLLRGFFEYYAHSNPMSSGTGHGFDWGRDVISLRTPGGLLSKLEKGWTGAKTVIEEVTSPSGPQPAAVAPATADGSTSPVQDDAGAGQQDQVTASAPSPAVAAAVPTPTSASAQQPHREVKEVRYRYLFAIEDPFELDHNVARTVTHNGIVAIRDEFRRAWRIIKLAGRSSGPTEQMLEDATGGSSADEVKETEEFQKLLNELHGAAWNEVFCSQGCGQDAAKAV